MSRCLEAPCPIVESRPERGTLTCGKRRRGRKRQVDGACEHVRRITRARSHHEAGSWLKVDRRCRLSANLVGQRLHHKRDSTSFLIIEIAKEAEVTLTDVDGDLWARHEESIIDARPEKPAPPKGATKWSKTNKIATFQGSGNKLS